MPNELPEDYFDKFPDRMFSRIEEDQQDDIRSELLSSIKKDSPYKIPEGYFTALPDQMISGYKSSKSDQTEANVKYLQPIRWMSVAAALTLLVMYAYQTRNTMVVEPAVSDRIALPDESIILTEEESLIWEEIIDEYSDEEIWNEAMAELIQENESMDNFLDEITDEEIDLYLDVLLADMTDLELTSL